MKVKDIEIRLEEYGSGEDVEIPLLGITNK